MQLRYGRRGGIASGIRLACLSALFAAHAANAQGAQTGDPYRNFIGRWIGTAVVNPDHQPSPIEVVVTTSPDGKRMIWKYTVGIKGQKGYSTPTKTFTFSPRTETITSEWTGYDPRTYTTTGLLAFAQDGYGTFVASTSCGRAGFFHTPFRHDPCRVAFELDQTTMSYTWTVTRDGNAATYSQFVFHRASP